MSKRVSVCVLLMLTVIGANLGFLNWTWMKHRERMNRITLVTEMRDQALYYGLGEMDGRTKALAEVDEQLIARDDLQNQYLQHVTGKMDRMHDEVLNVGQKLVEHENVLPTLIAEKMPSVVSIFAEHAFKVNPYTGEPLKMSATGVVIGEGGVILTASHVVSDYDPNKFARFWVEFEDGTVRDIEQIAFAEGMNPDIGVVWVDPEGLDLQPVPLVWDNEVVSGECVLVLGNPCGESMSASSGIVSHVDRMSDLISGKELPFLQVDSPINGGSSGGPVFDMDGNMIGIVSWHYPDADGVDFAVPMREVGRGLARLCAPIDVEGQ